RHSYSSSPDLRADVDFAARFAANWRNTRVLVSMAHHYDYDWLVVGSGFGGSVSALRLAEKGYRVGVLECGRRFEDADFPSPTWDMRNYFWAPKLGMRGIFRLSVFKDVAIASGC